LTQENLNYSAEGLKNIFPKYFPGNLSESYARNPQKIASKVYGGRMGNGVESTGEGYKFRGRGYIQLTGKDNYTAFGRAINEDILSNPDLVSTKYPLLSAAWFFSKNCLKKCVDASDVTVTSVTKCVNGGTIGLPDRLKHFKEYYHLLA
jgi:putative chitinase